MNWIAKGKYLRYIIGLWVIAFLSFFFVVSYFWALNANFLNMFGEIPSLENLENPRSELASEIYTADNVLMGKYYRENRTPVEYEELSPYLINCLIATEDARFEEHPGIDLEALMRVALYLGKKGGGSTLTQQLAKNLFRLRQEERYQGWLEKIPMMRSVVMKSKEWLTAIKIEQSYTKKEIITMYLNTVEFGSNAFGIHTASKTFFDKEPSQLTLPEAAVLVGLLQAPTRYSPISNYNNAIRRRNVVISQVAKYKYISESEAAFYQKTPIELRYGVEELAAGIAPYFRIEARKFLLEWAEATGHDLYADGLRIYTTIDSKMQEYAEEAVKEHMKKFQKIFYEHWQGRNPWVDQYNREMPNYIENLARRTPKFRDLQRQGLKEREIWRVMNTPVKTQVFTWDNATGIRDTTLSPLDSIRYQQHFLHTGFMAMEPKTGQVKAWVGGIDFKFFQYDHVKQGTRQPGSTFKPIVYVTALDNGYTPCSQFRDEPVTFGSGPYSWTARNSYGSYSGQMLTLRQALGQSVNSVTAGITKRVGVPNIIQYARDLGITSPLEAVPTLCLGASDVSVYELLGAYATFANKGRHVRPQFITRIEDRNGNVIAEFVPEVKQVISEEIAYLMLHLLTSATEPGGTSTSLHSYGVTKDNQIGAKTGTTQNNSDAWFMGVTQDLAAGLWVGGDNRSVRFRTIALGQGAVLALPVWGLFMQKVYEDPRLKEIYRRRPFEKPENLSIELDCNKARLNTMERYIN
ncbi:penicillin-binding protein 1A [Eisenibacter elegans]|uniref:penicillin-binding protein 1A n=1 Tax=Eisenibacter elegans TaxID=997 RepID=UPI0005581D57|nr:transglycosylase domain-containing protein [Eisenibacter elegans]